MLNHLSEQQGKWNCCALKLHASYEQSLEEVNHSSPLLFINSYLEHKNVKKVETEILLNIHDCNIDFCQMFPQTNIVCL